MKTHYLPDSHPFLMPRTLKHETLLLGLIAAFFALLPTAKAAGLGEATLSSALAQPLKLEIAIIGDDASALEAECFRLSAPRSAPNDDLPWLQDARLRLDHRSGATRLIVSTHYPIQHPAMMVGISIACGAQVRREYPILLAPGPRAADAAERSEIEPPVRKASTNKESSSVWTTTEGESASVIAGKLFPDDPRSARRFSRELIRRNRAVFGNRADAETGELVAGTRLTLPEPGYQRSTSDPAPVSTTPERESVARRLSGQAKPPSAKAMTRTPGDRLTVAAAGELGLRSSLELGSAGASQPTPSESERDHLRREQDLLLAIDDRIASQIELNDRVRQLESVQKRLQEENQRLAALIARQNPSAAGRQAEPETTGTRSLYLIAAAVLAALALIGFTLRARREKAAVFSSPLPTGEAFDKAQADRGAEVDFDLEPLTTADIWPDADSKTTTTGSDPLGDWEPATISPASLGPSSLLRIDDAIEEHDSAVELAEIMMSFGRVQGAAETLAEFIRANPKQAVRPWVKLLEVYRVANLRSEFDALAHQLNKTFNVKAVSWDDFDEVKQVRDTIEQLPHLTHQLVSSWNTRSGQAYVYKLLRDNRQGTRQGFPLGIVDDLLMLSGVLEINLGVYRPTAEEEAEMQAPVILAPEIATVDNEPVTEVSAEQNRGASAMSYATESYSKQQAVPAQPAAGPGANPFEADPLFVDSMIEFNLDEELPLPKPKR